MVVSISDRQQMNSVILLPFELEVQMVLEYKKTQYATVSINCLYIVSSEECV